MHPQGCWPGPAATGSRRLPCSQTVTRVQLPTLYLRNLDKPRRGLTLEKDSPRRVPTPVVQRGEALFEKQLPVAKRCQKAVVSSQLPVVREEAAMYNLVNIASLKVPKSGRV